jgi:hypothetical protein
MKSYIYSSNNAQNVHKNTPKIDILRGKSAADTYVVFSILQTVCKFNICSVVWLNLFFIRQCISIVLDIKLRSLMSIFFNCLISIVFYKFISINFYPLHIYAHIDKQDIIIDYHDNKWYNQTSSKVF